MIVDCQSCGATYNISDEKIRGRRVRVRCKTCSEGIIVDGTQLDADEATRVYSPTFEPAQYAKGVHDEATRVMAPSGPDLQASAATAEWTVAIPDSEQRNMELAELISSYTGGLIPDEALVWREGMDDWQRIRDVPEIQAAIESSEATHVVSPAVAVRAPRRAVGDRAVRRTVEAAPARAPLPSLIDVEQVAEPSAPKREASPVPAMAPAAPQASALSSQPSAVDVDATLKMPRGAPPPAARGATARVRAGRAGGTDLFGNVANAGGEEALLGSSALSQYEDKGTGARNESSVLFSLDALKAGAKRGSSAPPRQSPSNPPPQQTAADILGMSAGGALPGIGASQALWSAPAIEAPPMAVSAIPTTPPRSKMDTLPPMMRPRRSSALPYFVAGVAVVMAVVAFFVLRERLTHRAADAETAKAEPTATAKPAQTTTEVANTAPAETPPEGTTAAQPSTPAPTATAQEKSAQGDGVNTPVLPQKPSAPAAAAAPNTAATARYEAAKAAMLREKPESAPKAPAAEGATDKAAKPEKLVLAEESAADDKPAAAPAEEPAAPPFDTSAAKSALEAASASASSCKKDDGPTGRGKVQVTFSSTGRATSANVIEGPFGGTAVGSCVAKIFRGAHVPAFSGDPVTVSKSFTIPE